MKYTLRMTEEQHGALRSHLFPGDNLEAVALLICGRRAGSDRHAFTVREVVTIPHDRCTRRPDSVTWPTDFIDALLKEEYGKHQAIIKVHSHPTGYLRFSSVDDESDRLIFSSIASLLADDLPHTSVIMTPDGAMFGRVLGQDGKSVSPVDSIMVIGDDIRLYASGVAGGSEPFMIRHAQAFGDGTTKILRRFSVAIIGCSGTGSVVAEQLARLGVGKLVLVDPDTVEEKNLNRILNSGKEDAYLSRPKVNVLASAIARMGLGQVVLPVCGDLISPEAVRRVAECDAVFGCMDGVEGRHMLNRLSTFYTLPYFDVGVRLDADSAGGVDQIAGSVRYLQPGRSSLLSRGVYNMERVHAEEIRRTNPDLYRRRIKEGYLRGVEEDRPAVISVNMFFASLMVNEFLARIHPYRNQPNAHYATIDASLTEMQFYPEGESPVCTVLQPHVGRGDVTPLLDRPALS